MNAPPTLVKVPSYLKGLVETRARTDAYVLRLETVIREVEERLAKAKVERDACDTLITSYNPNLDPNSIEPIRAWRGKYGKRGEKAQVIREFVQATYPAAVSTAEVAWHLTLRFDMDFPTPESRAAWRKTSVRNPLRQMAERGEIERLELVDLNEVATSTWRWVPGSKVCIATAVHAQVGPIAEDAPSARLQSLR